MERQILDEEFLTEEELPAIFASHITQMFNEATNVFLKVQKQTPEQEKIIEEIKKSLEGDDDIASLFGSSIGALFADIFDKSELSKLANKEIKEVYEDEYWGIDLNEDCRPVNDVKQHAYTQYINRMMKH